MMKSHLLQNLALAVAFGVVLSVSPAAAPAQSSAETKILALENVWNTAEKAGDIGALSLIFDDAMVYIDEDGSVLSKDQFLEHAKIASGQLLTLVTDGVNVHVYDDAALVEGNYRVSGMSHGKLFHRAGRFIDTWIFKNGTWLCVAAQSTPVQS